MARLLYAIASMLLLTSCLSPSGDRKKSDPPAEEKPAVQSKFADVRVFWPTTHELTSQEKSRLTRYAVTTRGDDNCQQAPDFDQPFSGAAVLDLKIPHCVDDIFFGLGEKNGTEFSAYYTQRLKFSSETPPAEFVLNLQLIQKGKDVGLFTPTLTGDRNQNIPPTESPDPPNPDPGTTPNPGTEDPNNNNPGTENPGSENPDEVVFRIKAGTGNGAWNTQATEIQLKIGQTLKIINDDSVIHQLHTNGSPCPHGQVIQPGGIDLCRATREFTNGPLYDHGTNGDVFIRAER